MSVNTEACVYIAYILIDEEQKIYAWSTNKKIFNKFMTDRLYLKLNKSIINMTSSDYNIFKYRNSRTNILYNDVMYKKVKNIQGWDNVEDVSILSTDSEIDNLYYDAQCEILNIISDMLVPYEIFEYGIKDSLDMIGYTYIAHKGYFTDEDIGELSTNIITPVCNYSISINFDMVALLSNYITNYFKIDNILARI